MKIKDIQQNAFAMPFTSPSFPKSDFKFFNREYLIITYETDLDTLRAVVPEPLKIVDPIVKYEFIRMADSTGFGDYTESGQIIPVEFNGQKGSYVHSMYLDDLAPIVGGRELWGFPKKYGKPTLSVDVDTLLGTLKYNSVDVAIGTMGYKYNPMDVNKLAKTMMEEPNFLLKIIPHVDGKTARICELVKYYLEDVIVKEAYTGPAALQLFHHALAPIADLPVKKVLGGTHIISDLKLGFGEVVYDYLTK